jgi:hypothetical protein
MFELEKQQVNLVKVSTPMENHGKEYHLSCVLTIEATVPNKLLNNFAAGLRDALYRMADKTDDTDLLADPEQPTVLRFAKMSPFDWEYEGTGYTAIVDYGLGGESDIVLGDAKVYSFSITPMEGGSVSVRCNILAHPDEADVGKLCAKQKQNIDLTLTPPAPQDVYDLFNEEKKAA